MRTAAAETGERTKPTTQQHDFAPPGEQALVDKPRRRRDPVDSRRRILEAAEEAFARRGFDGARLRDIAQTAGVHHALVHHYYQDKEGLFRAVIEHALERLADSAARLLPQPGAVPDALEGLVSFAVDFFCSQRNLALIMEAAYRDPGSAAHRVVSTGYDKHVKPLLATLIERAKSAQEDGLLRNDIDAEKLLVLALGAVAYRFHSVTAGQVLGASVQGQDLVEEKRTLVRFLDQAVRSA